MNMDGLFGEAVKGAAKWAKKKLDSRPTDLEKRLLLGAFENGGFLVLMPADGKFQECDRAQRNSVTGAMTKAVLLRLMPWNPSRLRDTSNVMAPSRIASQRRASRSPRRLPASRLNPRP